MPLQNAVLILLVVWGLHCSARTTERPFALGAHLPSTTSLARDIRHPSAQQQSSRHDNLASLPVRQRGHTSHAKFTQTGSDGHNHHSIQMSSSQHMHSSTTSSSQALSTDSAGTTRSLSSTGSEVAQDSSASADGRALTDDDFVVAMPAVSTRLRMAFSTRVWRQTLRTAIVLEDAQVLPMLNKSGEMKPHEVYMVWPDEIGFTGSLTKDVRAGVVPLLAHRVYGGSGPGRGYKWMLFGDDDTLFFMDNVKALLRDYDPEVPMLISDNLWWNHTHHNFGAPRCLPCHLKTPENEALLSQYRQSHPEAYIPPWGCPHCTMDLACKHYWDRMPPEDKNKDSDKLARQRRREDKANTLLFASIHKRQLQSDTVQSVHLDPGIHQPGVQADTHAQGHRTPHSAGRGTGLTRRRLQRLMKLGRERMLVDGKFRDPAYPKDWEQWSRVPQAPPQAPPSDSPSDSRQAMYAPVSWEVPERTPMERRVCHHTVGHGGAGVILSVGLMRLLDLDKFVECMRGLKACAGGDCRFSVCVRDILGITYTDPGHSVFAGNDKLRTIFDNEAMRQLKRLPSELVARGLCTDACQFQVSNAVALHIKTRSHHSVNMAAAHMFFAAHSHQAAQQYHALQEEMRHVRASVNQTG